MKSIVKSSFYFSAYPLKAIPSASAEAKQPGSPYLRAVLTGKPKVAKRGKVLPMINHYNKHVTTAAFEDGKLRKDIEQKKKEWFNHYE